MMKRNKNSSKFIKAKGKIITGKIIKIKAVVFEI
jgi:hypothetical protein